MAQHLNYLEVKSKNSCSFLCTCRSVTAVNFLNVFIMILFLDIPSFISIVNILCTRLDFDFSNKKCDSNSKKTSSV